MNTLVFKELKALIIPFIILIFFKFFEKNIYSYTGFSFTDIFIICIISIVAIKILRVAQLSKYKVVLSLFSVYIFLHFVFFPIVYVFLIKSNSKSFDIDNSILTNEKELFLEEIKGNYSPILASNLTQVTSQIYKDTSTILDKNIAYLKEGNIIILKQYIISITTKDCSNDSDHTKRCQLLNICDKNGHSIFESIQDNNMVINSADESVRNILQEFSNENRVKVQGFKEEEGKLKTKNKIWSYSRILPYSLNIYTTGNLQPKTKLSNIIFHIHQIILSVGILGFIINLSSTYLSTQAKGDS